jgi:hypothetical protein
MKNFIHHDLPKLERITSPNGTRVYSTPSGQSYPSITTVVGLHSKQGIMEWRKKVGEEAANKISRTAAARGTRIHTLCENYLLGVTNDIDMFDQEIFKSILPDLNKINNIHALETPLYSDHLEVAGTVDCIAEYDGRMAVIDFKTSAKIKKREYIHGYFMQTSAYAVAFEERTGISVNRMVIIMGIDNEDPLVFIEKRDDWIGNFRELRNEYKRINKI